MEFVIKTAFANTFVMYTQASIAHWNVTGMLFKQFHDYFGELYEEIYGSVDAFAEHIRIAGYMTHANMDELYKYKTINEMPTAMSTPDELIDFLIAQNTGLLVSLNNLFKEAVSAQEEGLADFVAGRIDAHKKHEWMLTSFRGN